MRFLALMVGVMGAAGAASAGELQSGLEGSESAAGQVVYEARFGGPGAGFEAPSFQLRFGSERQVLAQERVPFLAEYRPATDSLLLNGLDVSPMLVNRQTEEGGGFASALGGWIPLLVIISAATFIAVDGNDLTEGTLFGSGGSGGN